MKDIVTLVQAQLVQYLRDLLKLIASPRRFVRTRNHYSEKSLTQCLAFSGVSFALYSILLYACFPNHADFFNLTVSHAVFLLLLSLLEVAELNAAWRLVGGKAPFGRTLVTFLYYQSVFMLIFGFLLLLVIGILNYRAPELAIALVNAMAGHDGGKAWQLEISRQGVANVCLAIVLPLFPLLVPWIWILVGWGAYRELNATSRRRSTLAFFVYVMLFAITLIPLYFIAVAFGGVTTP